MAGMTDLQQLRDLPIIAGFLYGIESDRLSREEVSHRVAGFRHTKGYEEALALFTQKETRTAVLAEVRAGLPEKEAPEPHTGGGFWEGVYTGRNQVLTTVTSLLTEMEK